MRSSEILIEMLLGEGPWDWAKRTAANFKQSKLAQHMQITKQPRKEISPVLLPVTPGRRVTHIAIVYGPNLPQNGYYMTGSGQTQLMNKLKKAMSQKLGNRAVGEDDASIINSWVMSGYQLFLRDEHGMLRYFGEEPRKLDPQASRILGIRATQPVRAAQQADSNFLRYQRLTGREFGASMTPEEEDAERYAQDEYARKQAELRLQGKAFDASAVRSMSRSAKNAWRRQRVLRRAF
jgi:hypothetical protein